MIIEEKCQGEGNCIVKQKDGVYFGRTGREEQHTCCRYQQIAGVL
jgi:hypothetical protein